MSFARRQLRRRKPRNVEVELTVKVGLFQLRQTHQAPAEAHVVGSGTSRIKLVKIPGRQNPIRRFIVVHRQHKLLEIILAG